MTELMTLKMICYDDDAENVEDCKKTRLKTTVLPKDDDKIMMMTYTEKQTTIMAV